MVRFSRKRGTRSKRVFRKNGRRGKRTARINRSIVRNVKNYVHSFKRRFEHAHGVATSSTSGYVLGSFSPNFAQILNGAEFQVLYDQYKINYVNYKIIWRSTSLSMIETRVQHEVGCPYIIWVIDRDDDTTPSSPQAIREYAKSKMYIFDTGKRVMNIGWKPNTLDQLYRSPVTTSYSISFNKWLDMADITTPYFGCKWAIICPYDNAVGNIDKAIFDIEATFYFQCKNPQ